MIPVAVAILNWNGLHHLTRFLPSVVSHSTQASVYVIDNGSTDNSVSWIKANYPQVKLIELSQNYGFCEGYNKGLTTLTEPYFILLNSDVEVSPQWITPMLELLEQDPSIAACQPKILDFNKRTRFEYAGGSGGFLDRYGVPFCRGRILNTLEEDQQQYNDNIPVHWASGAALMIRSTLFRQLGGFDQRFFAHMEEIDLCWRLRILGYQIYACPSAVVYHLGAGTLSAENPKKTFLNVRNNLFMLQKNLPKHSKTSILFSKLIIDGIAGVYFFLTGKWSTTFAIIKGHFAFYTGKSVEKIHTLPDKGKHEAYTTLFQKSILWEYYKKGNTFFSRLNWN